MHRENQQLYKLSCRLARRQSLAHPMSEFLGTITIAIVLWFGGTLILHGSSSITAPSFIYYMVIFYSIINPAKDLSNAAYNIQRGLASMERVDLIMKAEHNIKDPEHHVDVNPQGGMVEYSRVKFGYDPSTPVVAAISFPNNPVQTGAPVVQHGLRTSLPAYP